jgi:hypothetical protein
MQQQRKLEPMQRYDICEASSKLQLATQWAGLASSAMRFSWAASLDVFLRTSFVVIDYLENWHAFVFFINFSWSDYYHQIWPCDLPRHSSFPGYMDISKSCDNKFQQFVSDLFLCVFYINFTNERIIKRSCLVCPPSCSILVTLDGYQRNLVLGVHTKITKIVVFWVVGPWILVEF